MLRYLAIYTLFICTVSIPAGINTFADDYYSRDPKVTYSDKFPDSSIIIRLPGYKLDGQYAPENAIGQSELAYTKSIDPDVLKIATGYVVYGGLSFRGEFSLYGTKDLGDYILLYFAEPGVVDGGFGLVYSEYSKNIIDTFFAGSTR